MPGINTELRWKLTVTVLLQAPTFVVALITLMPCLPPVLGVGRSR